MHGNQQAGQRQYRPSRSCLQRVPNGITRGHGRVKTVPQEPPATPSIVARKPAIVSSADAPPTVSGCPARGRHRSLPHTRKVARSVLRVRKLYTTGSATFALRKFHALLDADTVREHGGRQAWLYTKINFVILKPQSRADVVVMLVFAGIRSPSWRNFHHCSTIHFPLTNN